MLDGEPLIVHVQETHLAVLANRSWQEGIQAVDVLRPPQADLVPLVGGVDGIGGICLRNPLLSIRDPAM